mgnify:CR=1 FL=1
MICLEIQTDKRPRQSDKTFLFFSIRGFKVAFFENILSYKKNLVCSDMWHCCQIISPLNTVHIKSRSIYAIFTVVQKYGITRCGFFQSKIKVGQKNAIFFVGKKPGTSNSVFSSFSCAFFFPLVMLKHFLMVSHYLKLLFSFNAS